MEEEKRTGVDQCGRDSVSLLHFDKDSVTMTFAGGRVGKTGAHLVDYTTRDLHAQAGRRIFERECVVKIATTAGTPSVSCPGGR